MDSLLIISLCISEWKADSPTDNCYAADLKFSNNADFGARFFHAYFDPFGYEAVCSGEPTAKQYIYYVHSLVVRVSTYLLLGAEMIDDHCTAEEIFLLKLTAYDFILAVP